MDEHYTVSLRKRYVNMGKASSRLMRFGRNQSGNVMYLTAGLLVPILATIGAGVDLGQAYMAKSRLQQACDAGVLSGRRAMAEGTFTTSARTAATRMFEFNYPDGQYSTTGRTFTPVQRGTNEVTATATATVPTIIMRAFGTTQISLAVSCTAKLETSNADIMMVLDTTGSMTTVNAGDSVSRIQGLREEVMAFYDTVMDAQSDTSVIRFGVVPYSSNVNVGNILRTANRNWLSNTTELPSRTPNFTPYDPPDLTTYGSVYFSNQVYGTWANTSTYQTGYSQNACNNLGAPAPTTPVSTSGVTTVVTGTTTDAQGRTVTTYEDRQNFSQTVYRWQYQSSNARCYRQSRSYTYRQNTPYTVTQTPSIMQFQNYTYQALTYGVGGMIDGTPLVVQTGTNGANVTASWNGCIMERDTVDFSSGQFPPADALDLDIDLVPTSEDRTKWKLHIPNIAHPSASSPGNSQTPAPVTTTSDWQSYSSGSNGTGGWSACPSPAMKMTAIPIANRSTLQTYVNNLVAIGGTYHDVGMVWGARLVSPTGLFASENATAANGNPISRHIIFMTDGELAPNRGIYGFQGQEYQMERVGGANQTEFAARHEVRFQAACNAAKARNITVWVVSFGLALNQSMIDCASGDKAYAAANKAQLHAQFQGIAAQITRLRLSE